VTSQQQVRHQTSDFACSLHALYLFDFIILAGGGGLATRDGKIPLGLSSSRARTHSAGTASSLGIYYIVSLFAVTDERSGRALFTLLCLFRTNAFFLVGDAYALLNSRAVDASSLLVILCLFRAGRIDQMIICL